MSIVSATTGPAARGGFGNFGQVTGITLTFLASSSILSLRMSGLGELEAKVMAMLLAGDDPGLEVLREQLRLASISKKENDRGFYIDFDVPKETPKIAARCRIQIFDVDGTVPATGQKVGFMLRIQGGELQSLNTMVYHDEPWPKGADLQLTYEGGGADRGDIEGLIEAINGTPGEEPDDSD